MSNAIVATVSKACVNLSLREERPEKSGGKILFAVFSRPTLPARRSLRTFTYLSCEAVYNLAVGMHERMATPGLATSRHSSVDLIYLAARQHRRSLWSDFYVSTIAVPRPRFCRAAYFFGGLLKWLTTTLRHDQFAVCPLTK
jgi:hypothetical protein